MKCYTRNDLMGAPSLQKGHFYVGTSSFQIEHLGHRKLIRGNTKNIDPDATSIEPRGMPRAYCRAFYEMNANMDVISWPILFCLGAVYVLLRCQISKNKAFKDCRP